MNEHTKGKNECVSSPRELSGRKRQIAKSVNPEPIDDRIFQELKLSGKSGILLG